MRKFMIFAMTGILTLAGGSVWAQKANVKPGRPLPVANLSQGQQGRTPLVAFGGSVTPSPITFTSSNPDGTQTNSSTTVKFYTFGSPSHFTVYAKAGAANFTGCNSPPAGSVTVACSNASGVTCAGSAALTSTGNGTTVATGSGNNFPASFSVTYTFQDGWNYEVGTTCSLSVSYLYTEP
jgi:hypothetical protein